MDTKDTLLYRFLIKMSVDPCLEQFFVVSEELVVLRAGELSWDCPQTKVGADLPLRKRKILFITPVFRIGSEPLQFFAFEVWLGKGSTSSHLLPRPTPTEAGPKIVTHTHLQDLPWLKEGATALKARDSWKLSLRINFPHTHLQDSLQRMGTRRQLGIAGGRQWGLHRPQTQLLDLPWLKDGHRETASWQLEVVSKAGLLFSTSARLTLAEWWKPGDSLRVWTAGCCQRGCSSLQHICKTHLGWRVGTVPGDSLWTAGGCQ